MSLVRLAVVDIPGGGSVVCADAELGHLFRLMQLQPPAQGDSGYQTSLRPTPFAGSSLRRLSHLNSSSDQCKETHH